MKKPNFFIIGAPKCGTTSLAFWLSQHPEVYMSPLKEPDYFHTTEKIGSLKQYEKLFDGACDEHKAVGEASVRYLYSDIAIPKILSYAGNAAKFIVILRNPIEMAPSLHAQRAYTLNENEPDFEKAWNLKNEDGTPRKGLPKNCYTPEINNYGSVCKVGEQLERLFTHISPFRCKLILLEDMQANPRQVWLNLMEFLEIKDDGMVIFQAKNKAKAVRSQILQKALKSLGEARRGIGLSLNFGLMSYFSKFNTVEEPRPPISTAMREELRTYFREDIKKILKHKNELT